MREWMVMFSYSLNILEGEIDPNFSFSEMWGLIQDSEYKPSESKGSLLIAWRALEFLQLERDEQSNSRETQARTQNDHAQRKTH